MSRVAAHCWVSPNNIKVGNWRDGDYRPEDPQERWMMNKGYRIIRAYYIEAHQEIAQQNPHPTPMVVPRDRYQPQEFEQ